MPSPFTLRRYQPEDFDALAALAVAASASPETACGQPDVASADEFATDYGHRPLDQEAWVAEADAQVVGFAVGLLRGRTLHVEGPIVAPAYQRRGIGGALFAKFEQDAAAHGAETIESGVRNKNTRGLRFLESLGYQPSRQIAVYECHERFMGGYALEDGYTIGELKPRYLLPFLMVMHECFPDYRLPSNPQRLFEPDKMKIFLALDAADRPVGAVTAFFYPEDRMAYIYHLGVSAPQRGHGIARALLVSACDWLWDVHQPHFIGLSASANSHGDPSLYERVGFELKYALQFCKKTVRQPAET